MNKYRTKDGQDYTIPNVGRTVNGEIETEAVIENPNFELVNGASAPSVQAVVQPSQPNAVSEATLSSSDTVQNNNGEQK